MVPETVVESSQRPTMGVGASSFGNIGLKVWQMSVDDVIGDISEARSEGKLNVAVDGNELLIEARIVFPKWALLFLVAGIVTLVVGLKLTIWGVRIGDMALWGGVDAGYRWWGFAAFFGGLIVLLFALGLLLICPVILSLRSKIRVYDESLAILDSGGGTFIFDLSDIRNVYAVIRKHNAFDLDETKPLFRAPRRCDKGGLCIEVSNGTVLFLKNMRMESIEWAARLLCKKLGLSKQPMVDLTSSFAEQSVVSDITMLTGGTRVFVVAMCLGAALLCSGFFVRNGLRVHASRNWPTAEGRILRHHRQKDEYGGSVEYIYRVNDQEFKNNKIFMGMAPKDISFGPFLQTHPVGSEVTVYYNPADPPKAILVLGMPMLSWMSLSGGILGFLTFLSLLIKWPSRKCSTLAKLYSAPTIDWPRHVKQRTKSLPISFSTIPKARTVIVVASIIAILWTLWALLCYRYPAGIFGDPTPAVVSATFLVIMLTTLIICLCVITRWSLGRWRIDDQRISYQPLIGQVRRIAWKEVDRVIWARDVAAIHQGRLTIRLPWDKLRQEVREPVQECISAILSERFDLTDPPRPPETSFKTIGSYARVIGVTLLTCIPILFVWYKALQDPLHSKHYVLVMGGLMFLPVLIAFLSGIRPPKRLRRDRWRKPR